jgi:hypothetical protein
VSTFDGISWMSVLWVDRLTNQVAGSGAKPTMISKNAWSLCTDFAKQFIIESVSVMDGLGCSDGCVCQSPTVVLIQEGNLMRPCRLLMVVLCLSMPLCAQSQISTGMIEGVVRDSTGAVLPGVTVTLRNLGIGISRTYRTSNEGLFTAPLLLVGPYEILAQLPSFSTVKMSGITVNVGQDRYVELVMKPSAISTTVEVQDKASGTNSFQFETSTVIENSQISQLPLNGRRFLDLALLASGLYQEHERGQLSLSGARGINSSINVDGADFNQPFFGGQRGGERSNFAYVMSQEAIQEFRVVQSSFSAEFGRSAGGVINVVTKSGSNEMHGSAFYYLRDRDFSERDMFGIDSATTRQQYGASLSGPLVKDKTFFFTVFDGSARAPAAHRALQSHERAPGDHEQAAAAGKQRSFQLQRIHRWARAQVCQTPIQDQLCSLLQQGR